MLRAWCCPPGFAVARELAPLLHGVLLNILLETGRVARVGGRPLLLHDAAGARDASEYLYCIK